MRRVQLFLRLECHHFVHSNKVLGRPSLGDCSLRLIGALREFDAASLVKLLLAAS